MNTKRFCQVYSCNKLFLSLGYCSMHYTRMKRYGNLSNPRITVMKRFMAKLRQTSSCWLWLCGVRGGYGAFWWKGKTLRAHRVAYELFTGAIPNGMHVLHHCDNPLCVKPSHLFLGTYQDNLNDKLSKGRTARGERHGMAKLREIDVRNIRILGQSKVPQRKIARRFHVDQATVHRILRGKNWNFSFREELAV